MFICVKSETYFLHEAICVWFSSSERSAFVSQTPLVKRVDFLLCLLVFPDDDVAAKPTQILRLRIILEEALVVVVVVVVAVFAVASIADVLIVVVIEVVCLRFFYIGFRLVRFFVVTEELKTHKKTNENTRG